MISSEILFVNSQCSLDEEHPQKDHQQDQNHQLVDIFNNSSHISQLSKMTNDRTFFREKKILYLETFFRLGKTSKAIHLRRHRGKSRLSKPSKSLVLFWCQSREELRMPQYHSLIVNHVYQGNYIMSTCLNCMIVSDIPHSTIFGSPKYACQIHIRRTWPYLSNLGALEY